MEDDTIILTPEEKDKILEDGPEEVQDNEEDEDQAT
jgi:hypothetical protein